MIEGIKNEILNLLRRNKDIKYVPSFMADDVFKELVVLRYLCDNTELTYDKLYEMNKEQLSELIKGYDVMHNPRLFDIDYKKLLDIIKVIDFDILLSGIKTMDTTIESIVDLSKKTLVIMNSKNRHYIKLSNVTYLCIVDDKSFIFKNKYYELFDKIYGVDNSYVVNSIDNIDLSSYEQILIYDDKQNYLYSKQEYNRNVRNLIYDLINKFDGDIYYRTLYKNISEFRSVGLLNNLSKVVISFDKDNEEAYLIFNRNITHSVSMIKYLSDSGRDYKKIISSNRANKDYLVKVKNNDIRNNNYRLGYGIYAVENIVDIKKLLNSNSHLVSKLVNINDDIEEELEKFFNKGELLDK